MLHYLKFTLSAICFVLAPTFATSEIIPGSSFQSGPWSGVALTNEITGELGSCEIRAFYQHNQTQLGFYLNKDYTMTIGVYDELARFPEGSQASVSLRVDRRQPFYGVATFYSRNMAFVTLSDMDAALDAMRRGLTLTIEGMYSTLQYGLNGTYRALDAAYACANKYYNYRVSVEATTSGEVWMPSREQERKMYQLSSALAADFGVSGIVYRDDENPMLVWDAPDASMWVGTVVGRLDAEQSDLRAEFGSDMATLSSWCSGELATVQREFEIDGLVNNETEAMCVSPDNSGNFTAHIVRQIAGEDVYEIVLFFDDSIDNSFSSLTNPEEPVGKAAALIAASFIAP